MLDEIRIKRAAQHNLKRIDVALPRNKLIVVTGPSGSGKSSLAFDTIFAEGQRRYIECLSAYARQFIDQMEKPEVESIEGISPAISIDQKTISTNPRSTVGTITEVYDLFRLLFARVGTPHCPSCGRVVSSQTPEEILERIAEHAPGAKVRILAPVVKGRKGEYQRLFERLRKKGFLRVRVNGVLRDLEDDIPLEKNRKHTIEVLVDTVKIGPDAERRLREAVEKALEVAEGEVLVVDESGKERFFSLTLLCPSCEVSLAELEPRNFSFNSPYGACPNCHGLGYRTTHNEWGEVELTDDVCPDCGGARLKKESLSVKIGGRNIHDVGELSIRDLLAEMRQARLPARRDARRLEDPQGDLVPPGGHGGAGHVLPPAQPDDRLALRRRGPARPAGGPGRGAPPRRPLRPRRADDRAPPARQRPAHLAPPRPPRRRQLGHRRRARRADHPGRRLSSSTSAPAPGETGGFKVAEGPARRRSSTRPIP